jgi:hypothetical protein
MHCSLRYVLLYQSLIVVFSSVLSEFNNQPLPNNIRKIDIKFIKNWSFIRKILRGVFFHGFDSKPKLLLKNI